MVEHPKLPRLQAKGVRLFSMASTAIKQLPRRLKSTIPLEIGAQCCRTDSSISGMMPLPEFAHAGSVSAEVPLDERPDP